MAKWERTSRSSSGAVARAASFSRHCSPRYESGGQRTASANRRWPATWESRESQLWRIETGNVAVALVRLAEMASVLGFELTARFYPRGDPIRDIGQHGLGKRFDALLSRAWRVTDETLLPNAGDLRAWDKLLRLTTCEPRHLVGVDLETRIRDIQALVRRTRERERDGGVDVILLVLSNSATNRRLVDDLRHALGPDYATPPRAIFASLRDGRPLPGSGVILI